MTVFLLFPALFVILLNSNPHSSPFALAGDGSNLRDKTYPIVSDDSNYDVINGELSNDDDGSSDFLSFHGDYSPPAPPPPSLPPHPPSVTCHRDLNGTGSLSTQCNITSSLNFSSNIYIEGKGSIYVYPDVVLMCPVSGCSILVNVSGDFLLSDSARIIAGTLYVTVANLVISDGVVINVTGLGGAPPEQTSGTPSGVQGGGGGHGGRGASCLIDDTKLPEDVWGGDTYSWSSLTEPWSYGSQGGTTSREELYGGGGGGRIRFEIMGEVGVKGRLLADGGDGGSKGGGGSGGSVYIKAQRMTGNGWVSASGGDGFAGGGGGRVSFDVFSRHDDLKVMVHGGRSLGCPENAGGAGTYYDAIPRKLIVSNHNRSTTTDTLLLEFPNQPLWTNIYILEHAKACLPLLWSRVQIQGQLSLSFGAVLSFGLAHYAYSEFELMAEELLMSDSVIKIYGALRMSVKMFLMWNSRMVIDGDDGVLVATSSLEATNLVVLKESSVIHSNANLGVHGQGAFNLSGPGDLIEAQRLVLSLFSSVNVGPGSILRGPLENASNSDVTPGLYCESSSCPVELLHPPEDCNVNSSLPFTLQICRVEDINIEGIVTGSVLHFHWVHNVVIKPSGVVSASGLGCTGGFGRGNVLSNGLGSGGGHGGYGGDGYYNGSLVEGGPSYGNPDLPCELGSGSGNDTLAGATAGGGIIVMGSLSHALASLSIDGALRADGESFEEKISKQGGGIISNMGPGGGSGGTILLFLQTLTLGESSIISTLGGHGSPYGGGGGGGGRVHFHWSNIATEDKYLSIATVKGSIQTGGGLGKGQGRPGNNGTVTGKACPKGLYGVFCEECPVGTFKNVSGSDESLCHACPAYELPHRAIYENVRGGVVRPPCPYKCISDRYHMPQCYTALEELMHTFGGPWLFGLILLGLLIVLALVLSVARMKYVGADELQTPVSAPRASQIDHSFPFLESLNEVLETNRTEESQSHVHRIYFMGPNTFNQPWHLLHSPAEEVSDIVYEDAFNRFVDEINDLAGYQWWEGSIYSVLSVVAYPLAWSWLQSRRRKKLQRLREFVRSEYDHSCLRSCRSRALYEGIKVASTSDLMLAYVDFFLGGDEKRTDFPRSLQQRFPMSLIFGGDGSYMTPFCLQNDNILTSLLSQSVPPTIWYRFVAGLNAQLRLVRRGHLKIMFAPVISWIDSHVNLIIRPYGVRVHLAWFQRTACGYCQYGLVVCSTENSNEQPFLEGADRSLSSKQLRWNQSDQSSVSEQLVMRKSVYGGILRAMSLKVHKEEKAMCSLLSFFVHGTKPIGHQDLVGLVISVLLLGDFSLVLLTLLQMYSISLLDFFLVLCILPLGIVFPFPAGIKALFSHGPKRSANHARLYAIWNITSVVNVVVAFICGFHHYKTRSKSLRNVQSWNFSMDESEWWLLPSGLLLCKIIQAWLIDCHVAHQEIQDYSLYSNDPNVFWQS